MNANSNQQSGNLEQEANAPQFERAPKKLVIATGLIWLFPVLSVGPAVLIFYSVVAITWVLGLALLFLCIGRWVYWARKVMQHPTRAEWVLLAIVPAIMDGALAYWLYVFLASESL